MLADQKRIRAGGEQKIDIVFGTDSAFDDKQPVIRNQSGEAHRRLKIHFKRFQVSIVHAHYRGAGLDRFTEFGLVLDFNERSDSPSPPRGGAAGLPPVTSAPTTRRKRLAPAARV